MTGGSGGGTEAIGRAEPAPAPRLAVARLCLHYVFQYMPVAIGSLLLPAWLTAQGLDAFRIGLINAVPILCVILTGILFGRLSDRMADPRRAVVAANAVSFTAVLLMGLADGFAAILLFWTLAFLPHMLVVPVTDAATLQLLRRIGVAYGLVRFWGSAGFVAALLGTGWALTHFGPAIFVPVVAGLFACRVGTALALPRLRPAVSAPATAAAAADDGRARRVRELLTPWILFAMIAPALVNGANMALNGFGAVVWAERGISVATISLLLAIAPAAEMAGLLFSGRLTRRMAPRALLLLCAAVAAFRWAVTALTAEPWIIALLQMLHTFTFGLNLVAMLTFVAARVDPAIGGQAQGLQSTIQQIVTVLTLGGFGWLVGVAGPNAFFASSAMCLLAAAFVLLSLCMNRTHDH